MNAEPRKIVGHSSYSMDVGATIKVVLVGTYPPTRCGIASFTSDLRTALSAHPSAPHCEVIVVDPSGVGARSNPEASLIIRPERLADYVAAAAFIRERCPDILCVQHEFGLYGGPAGANLITLLDCVTCPIVSVLHTVLASPNSDEERVFRRLLQRSNGLIVMSEPAREILLSRWSVDPQDIVLIPHGIPDGADGGRVQARDIEWGGRRVLLSFGLLSPDKGIATAIAAMPSIVAACPSALYVVAGITHPNLVAHEGERYREDLISLAGDLGVIDYVRFRNEYLSTDELVSCIKAADACVTPYRNPKQVTSGTLSYAVGLGRQVISTPFLHAQAALTNGRGVIVPFDDPNALATAAISLLNRTARRVDNGDREWATDRPPAWHRLADAYLEAFRIACARAAAGTEPTGDQPEHAPSIDGLRRMTDDCGLLQHSLLEVPNRHHGYCLDDNARALLLMHQLPQRSDSDRLRLARTYAAFVEHAWCNDAGCFRNFLSYERTWLESKGSGDSFARAFWAACVTAVDGPTVGLRSWGRDLVERVAPHLGEIIWLRSNAFLLLGLCALREGGVQLDGADLHMASKTETLAKALGGRPDPDWYWFEDSLSYDNARLPEALIRVGQVTRNAELRHTGLRSLRWLCERLRGPDGVFRPVGTESFGVYRKVPSTFDQQPLEAAAVIDACKAAYFSDADPYWTGMAESALRWFEGGNALGADMAGAGRGECFDGLGPSGINRNQGAESTLARQFALCSIEQLRIRARFEGRRSIAARGRV